MIFLLDDSFQQIEACCQSAEIRGADTIEVPDFFAMSVADARTLIDELEIEETVNWDSVINGHESVISRQGVVINVDCGQAPYSHRTLPTARLK